MNPNCLYRVLRNALGMGIGKIVRVLLEDVNAMNGNWCVVQDVKAKAWKGTFCSRWEDLEPISVRKTSNKALPVS